MQLARPQIRLRLVRSAPPQDTEAQAQHGTVALDPCRAGRESSRIADEVIAHFVGLVGADARVALEMEAIPNDVPRQRREDRDGELGVLDVLQSGVRAGVTRPVSSRCGRICRAARRS